MAGLKYKVGRENLLFGLRMFSFFLFRVGRGFGLKVFEKTFKRILNLLIASARVKVIV